MNVKSGKYILLKRILIIAAFLSLSCDFLQAQVQDTARVYTKDTTKVYRGDSDSIFATRKRRQLSADQRRRFKGVAFGVDRDTLQYIIASPFDNWFFGAGAGIQEYHGNELVRSARWNMPSYNFCFEIGKWIIPDLSVSVFGQVFGINSQSQYILNPYIARDTLGNFTEDTTQDGYYHISAPGVGVGGLVSLDWTNFVLGYEKGRAKRFHLSTPIGLGYVVNFGERKNFYRTKDQPFNQELYATIGLQANYRLANHIILTSNLRTTITRQSFDFSPYDNQYSNLDMMFAANVGIRIDLFKEVYITNPQGTFIQEINHQFMPTYSDKVVQSLRDKLRDLNDDYEAQQRQMGEDSARMASRMAAMQHEIDSLNNLLRNAEGADIVHKLYNLVSTENPLSAVVYFQLDRYDLDHNALKILGRFAEQIKKFPEDTVFYIIGGADSATGTPQHNWWLSNRRCESIFRALTHYYGVNPRQLEMYPLGGISEYHPFELNRIGIMAVKTEDISSVINSLKAHSEGLTQEKTP